ncbi:MAG: glycosyltransferase [Selenomonas sp.]|uniref:glycosyltransferase n=1 Tax=Selenomonas sp. TaxID=2053611 RepID=UPI0025EC8523|nr:glycosyltransferase [Selenomonas sp.]MCI6231631.1 glycosyltransferase [Selenomonas sp.]
MDENKIILIVYKHDEAAYQRLAKQITLLQPPVLHGRLLTIELAAVAGTGNKAAAYNAAMEQSDARYKVYLDDDILFLHPALLQMIVQAFDTTERAGMIGIWGSSLPLHGDFRHAQKNYGHYVWRDPQNGKNHHVFGAPGVWFQRVQAVDGSCLATCVDVPWDEEVDEAFLATAHACALRAKGWETYVPVRLKQSMAFIATHPSAYFSKEQEVFEQARKGFLSRYQKQLYPLVSILIPAYNQPEFCKEALESALKQDYPNTEILIGDDSTDQRVYEALRPLIETHDNIHYYYRGNLEGEDASKNVHFLLNECHGEYVNLLFHDDLIYPNKISKMMAYFAEDVDQEIAFVTSRRDFINADGGSLGEIPGYGGVQDAAFNSWKLCRKMLMYQENFIGEMSTVLLRKSLLWQKDAFCVGRFCGYQENSMGDISTWLELLKDGRTCVFLNESLSAFRDHPQQNTHQPDTFLLSYLDWLNLLVLAHIHQVYLGDEDAFREACRNWDKRSRQRQAFLQEHVSAERQPLLDIYLQEMEAVEAGDFSQVIQLCRQYMVSAGAVSMGN